MQREKYFKAEEADLSDFGLTELRLLIDYRFYNYLKRARVQLGCF